MKKAQIVVEYAILSIIVILMIVAFISVPNIRKIGAGSAFGLQSEGSRVIVPPMTP